jgi:hypothetical protein
MRLRLDQKFMALTLGLFLIGLLGYGVYSVIVWLAKAAGWV